MFRLSVRSKKHVARANVLNGLECHIVHDYRRPTPKALSAAGPAIDDEEATLAGGHNRAQLRIVERDVHVGEVDFDPPLVMRLERRDSIIDNGLFGVIEPARREFGICGRFRRKSLYRAGRDEGADGALYCAVSGVGDGLEYFIAQDLPIDHGSGVGERRQRMADRSLDAARIGSGHAETRGNARVHVAETVVAQGAKAVGVGVNLGNCIGTPPLESGRGHCVCAAAVEKECDGLGARGVELKPLYRLMKVGKRGLGNPHVVARDLAPVLAKRIPDRLLGGLADASRHHAGLMKHSTLIDGDLVGRAGETECRLAAVELELAPEAQLLARLRAPADLSGNANVAQVARVHIQYAPRHDGLLVGSLKARVVDRYHAAGELLNLIDVHRKRPPSKSLR